MALNLPTHIICSDSYKGHNLTANEKLNCRVTAISKRFKCFLSFPEKALHSKFIVTCFHSFVYSYAINQFIPSSDAEVPIVYWLEFEYCS